MLSRPFFSVVLTTYNRKDFILRALNSLIQQDSEDWEAILIDDGSQDQTHSLIEHLLQENSRIQYVYQKNQGFEQAKNKGISLGNGEYITFLDSDDEYLTNHLSSRKEILTNRPVDFLHGGVQIIGSPRVPDLYHPGKTIHLSECAIGGSFFIKTEKLKILKGFRQKGLGADADLLQRAIENNFDILKIENPKTYIYHRSHPDSLTHYALQKRN